MKVLKQTKLLNFISLKGIDQKKVKELCISQGSNPNNIKLKLKNSYFITVSKQIHTKLDTKQIIKKIKFFWNIKLYRGIKHMLKLPVHGQRTKTNSKTKRKFNFFK